MVEGLLEINMIITNLLLFYIVVHCYQFKGQLPVMTESLKSYGMELNETSTNALTILEDMIDILEENGGVQSIQMGKPATGGGIPELLLGALMNKTNIAESHGTKENEVGEIHEEELSPKTE